MQGLYNVKSRKLPENKPQSGALVQVYFTINCRGFSVSEIAEKKLCYKHFRVLKSFERIPVASRQQLYHILHCHDA